MPYSIFDDLAWDKLSKIKTAPEGFDPNIYATDVVNNEILILLYYLLPGEKKDIFKTKLDEIIENLDQLNGKAGGESVGEEFIFAMETRAKLMRSRIEKLETVKK
ncbi:hypothetical protein AA12717_0278 [Gluconacetobacter sacchari DSM 12717]|nr:hypothetical protein AA12717_0278 [Gluconacetobacter sacchari DSM 12717]